MSIGKRLKQIITNKNINLKEFSKKSEIPYRTLQEYVADNSIPGGESLIKISTKFDVNINWLLTGQGEMYQTPTLSNSEEKLDQTIAWLREWWQQANEEERQWFSVQMQRCFPEYLTWLEIHPSTTD